MSTLHDVPVRRRRQLALLIAPTAGLLLLAGVVLLLSPGLWRLLGTLLTALAVLLLAICVGLGSSARADERAATSGGPCGDCTGDCAVKALPRL